MRIKKNIKIWKIIVQKLIIMNLINTKILLNLYTNKKNLNDNVLNAKN